MPGLMAWLGLDASAFHAGMRKAQTTATEVGGSFKSSLGASLAGFGGAVAGGAMVAHVLEATEHIRKLSQEFRVSTDTIQIWERGASKVDMSAEDIGNAFNRLKKAREKAIENNDNSGFRQFGITIDELKNSAISTEQIMDRMRAAVSGRIITDEQDVAGMELMGRSGAKILSAMEQINKMGPIKLISPEDIESVHEVEATLKRMRADATVGGSRILGTLARWTEGAVQGAANVIDTVRQNLSGNIGVYQGAKQGLEGDVPAPEFDLKGRRIMSPKAKPVEEPKEKPSIPVIAEQSKTKKEIAETEKLQSALTEKIYQNHLRTLTPLQKELTLKKEIKDIEAEAAMHEFFGDEDNALKAKIQAEELRGQLGKTESKAEKRTDRIDFNSTERIGGFFPGSGKLANAGIDHAKATADHTARTAHILEQMAKAISSSRILKDGELGQGGRTHEAVRFG